MAKKEEKKTSWEQTVVTYLHDWLYLLIGIFVIFAAEKLKGLLLIF